MGNRLVSGLVRHRDVDVLGSDLLSNPSVKFISLAVLVRDSIHDAADVLKKISKLLSCIRDVFSVTSTGLLFVKLVKALELTPLNVIVKMEVVELVSELLDLLVESNGFSADDKKFVLELSEFFNKLLKLVSQISGLILVLANHLDQVLNLSLIELGLALELVDSVAEDVALGEGHLVDLDKHLKLLEIEQKSFVLFCQLSA
jgi:hypothetical protein